MFKTAAPGFILCACLAVLSRPAGAGDDLKVYAAASLTNALTEISAAYEKAHDVGVRNVYAASSTLARQIEAGAPAQVFISADQKWMDYLQDRGHLQPGTRRNLLGNTLVLIAPRGKGMAVTMAPGFDLPAAFNGKLCTGDPDSVPAGIYARQGLQKLGWWNALKGRVVGTDDVRTALAFVERAECRLGVVYATDAAISSRVEVIATFPEDSHDPVIYPVALVQGASAGAQAYEDFLASDAAKSIFLKYGFTVLKP